MKDPNPRHEEPGQVRRSGAAVRVNPAAGTIVRAPDPETDLSQRERAHQATFCMEMAEFLGNLCAAGVLDPDDARVLRPLAPILENAADKLSSRDAARPEQRRQWELCLNSSGAFFATVDETGEALQDMCAQVYGLDRSKWPSVAKALVLNQIRGWNDWKQAASPIGWVHEVAETINRDHFPLAMEEDPGMLSLDAPSPTGDPYAAVLPDLRGDRLVSEIHARVDLVTACTREHLSAEAACWALGRYNRVSKSDAVEVLGLSQKELAAASRELGTAMPALKNRLAPYRPAEPARQSRKQRRKVKRI